jgi:hypothetical protein
MELVPLHTSGSVSTHTLTAKIYITKFYILVYLELILSNLWFVQNLLGDFILLR